MEEKIRLKLRPVRIIVYLLFFVSDLFLYLFLQNYFLWLIAFMMVILPAISVAVMIYLCKNVRSELGIGERIQVKEKEVLLELRLHNPTWFMALQCQLRLNIANIFLENASELTVSMPVKMHKESVLRLPVRVVELGKFTFTCETLLLQDMMGLVIGKKAVSLSKELYVVPDGSTGRPPDVTGFLSGAAEVEESKSKGSDFSEVNDIREYLPGDRQRDIHWKLSARQDELMVKERTAVAGSEMVILPELTEKPDESMRILESVYQLGRSCMLQRTPICLLCWNHLTFQFEEYRCISQEELTEAYCEFYQIRLTNRVNKDYARLMRNCYPYLKSYLCVGIQEIQGETVEIKVEMRENG